MNRLVKESGVLLFSIGLAFGFRSYLSSYHHYEGAVSMAVSQNLEAIIPSRTIENSYVRQTEIFTDDLVIMRCTGSRNSWSDIATANPITGDLNHHKITPENSGILNYLCDGAYKSTKTQKIISLDPPIKQFNPNDRII